jgi:antitoxin (DNA-binding transcriptional repressor) of toxin-antitoxin stability system
MDHLPVSRFKATCLAVLQRVKRTRRAVIVTRFGKPVAKVVPPPAPAVSAAWLGTMAARTRITGDVVAPALDGKAWTALRG